MNYINAVVRERESLENINLVSFEADKQSLKMISLELSDEIKQGKKVVLGIKSTNIALAKNLEGELSISNQLRITIASLNFGKLLCSVKFLFAGEMQESVITKASAERMGLKVGDEIIALIKSSDLSIVEVL
jgi:molybdopterin-binding protein